MDQLNVNIRLKYVTLLAGVFGTALVVAFFWHKTQPINVLFSVIAAGTAVTALVYTAINSQFTNQVHIEQLRVKKLENAMTFIEYSTSPQMVQSVECGVALRDEVKGKSAQDIKLLLENAPDKKRSLIMIFNYFERLGVLVRLGAADEDALRNYYQAAVKRYWHSFRPWVEYMRNELQDTALFSEIEGLVDRWN